MGHVHKYDYHFGTVWVCHTFTHFICIIWCDLAILGFIQPWLKDVKTCKGLKIFCSIFPKIMTKPWWQGNDAKIHIILKYKMIRIHFKETIDVWKCEGPTIFSSILLLIMTKQRCLKFLKILFQNVKWY